MLIHQAADEGIEEGCTHSVDAGKRNNHSVAIGQQIVDDCVNLYAIGIRQRSVRKIGYCDLICSHSSNRNSSHWMLCAI